MLKKFAVIQWLRCWTLSFATSILIAAVTYLY